MYVLNGLIQLTDSNLTIRVQPVGKHRTLKEVGSIGFITWLFLWDSSAFYSIAPCYDLHYNHLVFFFQLFKIQGICLTKYFKIVISPPVYFCTLKMPFPQCISYEKASGVLFSAKFKNPYFTVTRPMT